MNDETVTLATDSDWASCRSSRRSISGGALFIGAHMIAGWSRLQQRVALSSGEAELYSSIRGLAEMVNLVNVHRELYSETWGKPELWTDATVNQAILMRRGAGGVKHVETNNVWSQDVIKQLSVNKYIGWIDK